MCSAVAEPTSPRLRRRPGARAGRRAACLLAASLLVLVAPAGARAQPSGSLIAFGDSFSSGEGGGGYDPASGQCDRSDGSWPFRLAAAAGLRRQSFACSGAKVDDVLHGGQLGTLPAQLSALDSHPPADIITISIGGNDVGFKNVLMRCATPFVHCDHLRRLHPTSAEVDDSIARLERSLAQVYGAIRKAEPAAKLVVMGYPRLFPRDPSASAGGISPTEMRYLNAKAVALDAAIERAVDAAGATYVDVLDALDGHEVTTADPWITVPQGPVDAKGWLRFVTHLKGTFHPNAEGYAALARVAIARVAPPAQPGARQAAPVDADALARRFEPTLLLDRGKPLGLDPGEQWRPLDVDAFLAEGWHRVCHRRDGSDCAAVAGAAGLQRTGPSADGAVAFLEVDGRPGLRGRDFVSRDRGCGLRDCAPQRIYYHAIERAGVIYLDYWWYLRFNDADLKAWDHQSDWEGAVVAVKRADTSTFAWVGFAQHTHVWRYPRAVLSCVASRAPGTCGTDGALAGSHVNVFLANGTHAAYPTACARRSAFLGSCREHDAVNGIRLLETDHDGLLPWGGNGKPAALAALGPWASWSGVWDPGSHVESPALQRRFREPWRVTDAPCPPEGCPRAAPAG